MLLAPLTICEHLQHIDHLLNTFSYSQVVNASDINIICTKPQYVQASLQHIAAQTQSQKLQSSIFVSIAAGITITQLESYLSNQCKIARLMPNTPCMVGEMAAGLSTNSKVRKTAK